MQHFIDVELNEMLELKPKYGTVAIANPVSYTPLDVYKRQP